MHSGSQPSEYTYVPIPRGACYENTLTNNPRPRANLTILGAFTGFFCTVGFLNSFGIFQAYYAKAQLADESESTIAWLGAISIFFVFSVSVVSGSLLDIFGPGVSYLQTERGLG